MQKLNKYSLIKTGLLALAPLSVTAQVEEISFARAHELISTYCIECHNPADEKGSLDLAVLETEADYLADSHLLEDLEWVIAEKEMPVPDAPKQPTEAERDELVAWLQQELMKIQNAMPNDPGRVVMPRVSSKDFDYSIEDMTGKDYSLSDFLTADTAGGEGFYNVGASQNLSIGQFESFMAVGKMLVNYSRWIPGKGIWWMNTSESPLESDADLAVFLKNSWYEWHENALKAAVESHQRELRRATPFNANGIGAYVEAAWQYKHRSALGMPNATIEDVAAAYEPALFPSALSKMIAILDGGRAKGAVETRDNPIFAKLVKNWQSLPAPQGSDPYSARDAVASIVAAYQLNYDGNEFSANSRLTSIEIKPANGADHSERRGLYHRGRGAIVIDLNKVSGQDLYLAATGRTFPDAVDPDVVWTDGEVVLQDGSTRPWENFFSGITNEAGRNVSFNNGSIRASTPGYIKFKVPQGAKQLTVFATYAPDQTDTRLLRAMPFTSEPPDYVEAFEDRHAIGSKMDDPGVRAAFKAMNSATYFAHGAHNLYDFDPEDVFIDATPEVLTYAGLPEGRSPEQRNQYWSSLWSLTPDEVRSVADEARTEQGREIWTALAAAAGNAGQSAPERSLAVREAISQFTAIAWRGAANPAEMDKLMQIYENEMAKGQPTETAVETAMRAVLIAPKFLYRFTESDRSAEPYQLESREIAVRLASVLWAGLPDAELYQLANAGQLQDPRVLTQQIDRMLAHPKADRFIEEFYGRWLHFAEFAGFGGPDQEKFKEWNADLSNDMHEEASLFIKYLLHEDKPLTDIFYADYSFLNQRLANHYGISGIKGNNIRFVQLDDPRRGGILGMGAFLTKTSTPLRTSPVHRGLWIYEDVLDLPVPEPPPVPLLSDDGVDEQGRSFVEQLRQHRDNPACYSCHDRFDPMGVALENFDPIGRWRSQIEGTAQVISTGEFRSGQQIDGIEGLKNYLREREDTLIEAFTTKLLGYSLGRSVLPTDQLTLDAMVENMRRNNLSMRSAIHTALTSPQFLYRRDPEMAAK